MLDYYPQETHEIHDPKEILNTYISMKKDLEKCVDFDPSVDEFWLYDFNLTGEIWMEHSMVVILKIHIFIK